MGHRAKFRDKNKCFVQVLFPVFAILRGIQLPVFCAHELSIENWVHSADAYVLAMSCVGYARVHGQKPFQASLNSNLSFNIHVIAALFHQFNMPRMGLADRHAHTSKFCSCVPLSECKY